MRVLLICLFFISATSQAQQLTARITDLSFLNGRWTQQHAWGDMEETWSAPMGDCITATFRCVKDGKVVFYEFMVVEQGDKVPVLKLRHFHAGSIAWEDKESPLLMPVVLLENNKVVFEKSDGSVRLTYTVIPGTSMKIVLDEKNQSGKLETSEFNMLPAASK